MSREFDKEKYLQTVKLSEKIENISTKEGSWRYNSSSLGHNNGDAGLQVWSREVHCCFSFRTYLTKNSIKLIQLLIWKTFRAERTMSVVLSTSSAISPFHFPF